MTELALVALEWPSAIRGPMRESEARHVARALGLERGRAYLYAAWLAENELSDGRGGERLHEDAERLCAALMYVADLYAAHS